MDMLAYFLGKQSGGGGGGGGDYGQLAPLYLAYYTGDGDSVPTNEEYYLASIDNVLLSDNTMGVVTESVQIAAGAAVTFYFNGDPLDANNYGLALFKLDATYDPFRWGARIGNVTPEIDGDDLWGGSFVMPEVNPYQGEFVGIGIVAN